MMEEEKCQGIHRIDGQVPQEQDIQYDGRNCDCGRLTYFLEPCGCPDKKDYSLRSKPNENHIS